MGTASLFIGAFIPGLVLIGASAYEKLRLSRIIKSPQEDKLLRPPGYSLSIRLDVLTDRIGIQTAWAMVCTALAGLLGGQFARLFTQSTSTGLIAVAILVLGVTAFAGTAFAVLAYRTLQERRRVQLGLRGEQAAAEALHEAADAGYRVFHDIQASDDWNIDHVAVGTKGVFLIETKARSRRVSHTDKPIHHVKFDGSTLEFPFGADLDSVAQARRNAGWLATFLTSKTGETVAVDPIVVLPGWWVEGRGDNVKAMNCKYLTKYLRGQKDRISLAHVERITTALDEKNRTLDFI